MKTGESEGISISLAAIEGKRRLMRRANGVNALAGGDTENQAAVSVMASKIASAGSIRQATAVSSREENQA